eukprot:2170204-Rhodomonas_salina.1
MSLREARTVSHTSGGAEEVEAIKPSDPQDSQQLFVHRWRIKFDGLDCLTCLTPPVRASRISIITKSTSLPLQQPQCLLLAVISYA